MSYTQEPTISPEPEPGPTTRLASVTDLAAYRANKAAINVETAESNDIADEAALKKEFWDEGRFWERRDTRRNMVYGTVVTIAVLGIYEYAKARGR